jgi:hypothetical protein
MDRDDDVAGKLQQALAAAEQCAKSETARDHEILVEVLAELRSAATRACHAHVDCASLIANLHAGKALSQAEMSTLRLMIVGDADSYLKYDEEFQRCKTELGRLLGELEEFRAKALDIDTLMRLNVLCQEAGAILTMAGHYLEQRDRVRNFDTATQRPLDLETSRSLAKVVTDMVRA